MPFCLLTPNCTKRKCSFCRHEPETLHHLMVHCPYSEQFWTDFKSYFFSLTGQRVQLSMRDVLFGIITSKCTLLNYLLLVGKLYLWECRRNKVLPNIYLVLKPKLVLNTKQKNSFALKTTNCTNFT